MRVVARGQSARGQGLRLQEPCPRPAIRRSSSRRIAACRNSASRSTRSRSSASRPTPRSSRSATPTARRPSAITPTPAARTGSSASSASRTSCSARPASSAPRISPARPPRPRGRGPARARAPRPSTPGIHDKDVDPSHVVAVEHLCVRYLWDDASYLWLGQSVPEQERFLSCSLNINWPDAARLDAGADIPDQADRSSRRWPRSSTPRSSARGAINSRSQVEDDRFAGWLSYSSFDRSCKALQGCTRLRQRGLGIRQWSRDLFLPALAVRPGRAARRRTAMRVDSEAVPGERRASARCLSHDRGHPDSGLTPAARLSIRLGASARGDRPAHDDSPTSAAATLARIGSTSSSGTNRFRLSGPP